jgi:ribosomal protein S18 acetylase RimI-like enzyme
MMDGMNVRVGLPGDFPTVMPMLRQHLALHERWDPRRYALRPDADARFQRWLSTASEDPRALILVAEEDGQILGFLAALVETDVPIYACDEYAVIFALWVEPAHRRRGAATALLDLAAREYAAMGIRQLRIRTATANAAGRAMLERAGFAPATVDLLRELEPAKAKRPKRGSRTGGRT